MKNSADLVGKTISGIVAVPTEEEGPLKIWMMQFTDGTHVEFVSPGARRTLDRIAKRKSRGRQADAESLPGHPQLALSVA